MTTRIILLLVFLLLYSCKNQSDHLINQPNGITAPIGMVWISGSSFTQGAKTNDNFALPIEKPAHPVLVDGFFMDITEVTNAQFQKFVTATNYITTAEKPINWEEMKKNLPPDTPKPPASSLLPGSLLFNRNVKTIYNYDDYGQWWSWQNDTNWKHPEGKGSNLVNKNNFPIVHISYEDALAYCKWANRRLPTEAEWELAARGTLKNSIYVWGDNQNLIQKNGNTWEGNFPVKNDAKDGYAYIAPVKSFAANSFGLYDMAGNVWEYTQDWYNVDYYKQLFSSEKVAINPQGATTGKNPNNPYQQEKIIKGGSFLCNASYCASYRISARMGTTPDSSSDHVGFRTVVTPTMLRHSKN